MTTKDIGSPVVGQDDRSLAQFFFEQGYFSCWSEAMAVADKPPFGITDKLLAKAWDVTAIARDDYAEFDSKLALADAAPDLLEALEAVELARTTDDEDDWERATFLTVAAIARATGASQ